MNQIDLAVNNYLTKAFLALALFGLILVARSIINSFRK